MNGTCNQSYLTSPRLAPLGLRNSYVDGLIDVLKPLFNKTRDICKYTQTIEYDCKNTPKPKIEISKSF